MATNLNHSLKEALRILDAEIEKNNRDYCENCCNHCEEEPLTLRVHVIFNDPATILFVNGSKYVSKAYKEKFDKEKGLLMCFAKAFGISHSMLKKMISLAEDQSSTKKAKEAQTSKKTAKKTKTSKESK